MGRCLRTCLKGEGLFVKEEGKHLLRRQYLKPEVLGVWGCCPARYICGIDTVLELQKELEHEELGSCSHQWENPTLPKALACSWQVGRTGSIHILVQAGAYQGLSGDEQLPQRSNYSWHPRKTELVKTAGPEVMSSALLEVLQLHTDEAAALGLHVLGLYALKLLGF